MDLTELFKFVGEQAVAAAGSRTIESPEPEHVYLLQSPDGTVQAKRAEPAPRAHLMRDLGSVLAFAGKGSSVWYTIAGVTCLLDDKDRRDKAILNLPMSKPLLRLVNLRDHKGQLKQTEFCKMLRIEFAGCFGRVPTIVAILSKVQFKVGSETNSSIGVGKASIGKAIEQEVRGTAAIPETIELDVPMFSGIFPQMRSVIECALEPDAASETFQLIPLPSAIDDAIRETEDKIGKLIHDELTDVPIYFGQP